MAIVALMATVVCSFVANAIVPIRPLAFSSLAPVSPPVLARLAKFEENLEAKLEARIDSLEAKYDALEQSQADLQAKFDALEQSQTDSLDSITTLVAITYRRKRTSAAIIAASLACVLADLLALFIFYA